MLLVGAMLPYAVVSVRLWWMFALSHGVSGRLAEQLVSLTPATVAASILLRGAPSPPRNA